MDCQQIHPYMSKDIRLIDIVHKLKKLKFCIKPTSGFFLRGDNITGKAKLTQLYGWSTSKYFTFKQHLVKPQTMSDSLIFSAVDLLEYKLAVPRSIFSQVTPSDVVLVQKNLVMRDKQLSKESKEYFSQRCLCERPDVRGTLIFGLPVVPWVRSNDHCFTWRLTWRLFQVAISK